MSSSGHIIIEMDDICTVRSILAALEPPQWTFRYAAWTCPKCGHEGDTSKCLHCGYDPQEPASTEPTPEWGDLEDHGWMGTSERNNPTIRDDFPASFGSVADDNVWNVANRVP